MKCDELKKQTRDVDYGLGPISVTFYEADAVDEAIAELKAENERLKKQSSCTFSEDCLRVRQLKAENERLKATPEQIMKEVFDKCLIYPKEMVRLDDAYKLAVSLRKQKYKRCLDRVRCCMADNRTLGQVTLNESTNHLQWLFNENFFVKWAARWFEIADKFKEGK